MKYTLEEIREILKKPILDIDITIYDGGIEYEFLVSERVLIKITKNCNSEYIVVMYLDRNITSLNSDYFLDRFLGQYIIEIDSDFILPE